MEAFGSFGDDTVVDGINITYGTLNHHIWSYVAGETEVNNYQFPHSKCPCNTSGHRLLNQHSLVITTTVNQATQTMTGNVCSIYMINYGMGSSVKVPAVLALSFHHGSQYGLMLKYMMQLKWNFCDEDTNNEDVTIKLLEIYVQWILTVRMCIHLRCRANTSYADTTYKKGTKHFAYAFSYNFISKF